MDKYKLYNKLLQSYSKAYPLKSKTEHQKNVIQIWKDIKNKPNVSELITETCQKYKQRELKLKSDFFSAWNKRSIKSRSHSKNDSISDLNQTSPGNDLLGSSTVEVAVENLSNSFEQLEINLPHGRNGVEDTHVEDSAKTDLFVSHSVTTFPKPAQDKLKTEINLINEEVLALLKRKETGFFNNEMKLDLKRKWECLEKLKVKLRSMKGDMIRKRKFRKQHQQRLSEICEKIPGLQKDLKVRKAKGRPRIEEDSTDLLKTMIEIAIHGSACHDKRREDMYRSVKSLSELREALVDCGFTISRSATYLRLLPRRSNTLEGKRHVETVPVRLAKAQNDLHANHTDTAFTTATINYLLELASLLGANQTTLISQE